MRSNRLGLTSPLQQKQLWQNSHRFQPDAESPEDFRWCVLVGEDDGEDEGAAEEVLDPEGVDVGVVGGLVGCGHQVDGVAGGAEE